MYVSLSVCVSVCLFVWEVAPLSVSVLSFNALLSIHSPPLHVLTNSPLLHLFNLIAAMPHCTTGPKENTKSGSTSTSKKAFSSPPTDKHGNGAESVKTPTPLGVPSPFLIDFLIQYITSACSMLDKDDSAMVNPLLSVNLIQLISVLLKWEHFSVYKAKSVNSLMNSLLRSVRNAVTAQRRKMLDSSPYLQTPANVDVDGGVAAEGREVVDRVTESTATATTPTLSRALSDDVIKSSAAADRGPKTAVLNDSAPVKPSLLPVVPSQPLTHSIDQGNNVTSKGRDNVFEIEVKEEEKQEVQKKENFSLQLLIELSCVIALFSSRSASILIKGNSHSMVRTYTHPYTQTHTYKNTHSL